MQIFLIGVPNSIAILIRSAIPDGRQAVFMHAPPAEQRHHAPYGWIIGAPADARMQQ